MIDPETEEEVLVQKLAITFDVPRGRFCAQCKKTRNRRIRAAGRIIGKPRIQTLEEAGKRIQLEDTELGDWLCTKHGRAAERLEQMRLNSVHRAKLRRERLQKAKQKREAELAANNLPLTPHDRLEAQLAEVEALLAEFGAA